LGFFDGIYIYKSWYGIYIYKSGIYMVTGFIYDKYTIQKGLAYCRLLENHIQAIQFTYFVQQEEVEESEKSDSSAGNTLQLETVSTYYMENLHT